MTDLFDFNDNEEKAKPLAERMRASSFKDFVGQEKLVSEGSLLRRAISLDRLGSCIFWGPPGCGKTTLANVIAAQADGEFVRLNAVTAGVADVRRAVEEGSIPCSLPSSRASSSSSARRRKTRTLP